MEEELSLFVDSGNEPLDPVLDEADVDKATIDGEDVDKATVDGEDVDGEDVDGEDVDGEDVDREDVDEENVDKDNTDKDEQFEALLDSIVSDEIKTTSISDIWSAMASLQQSAKVLAVKLKSRDPEKIDAINDGYWKDLQKMLWAFRNIKEDMKLLQEKQAVVQGTLQKLIADPTFNFPSDFIMVAEFMMEKFQALNWGKPLAVPQIDDESDTESEDEKPAKKKRKTSATTQPPVTYLPPPNHPVFGANGIMRGILISQKAIKSYSISKEYTKTPSTVFGANGLNVGDWWPRQLAALRDGAHGNSVGGISGNEKDGCRSVVLSKGYEDRDIGDRILYSSVLKETLAAVRIDSGTKMLLRSIESSIPIRVLRGHRTSWVGAPPVGLRYDGLYQVVNSKEITTFEKGKAKAYCQFELVRLAGQAPINRAIPSAQQVRGFNQISQGY
ncbi:hypothetical protein D0Z07_3312 [Hyphodiscus hymeniophilus]|uniref:YDG domain-containing protein n=1 Tax=Hyphodiscus hymeniophilus TaxID=353542 RepID=A0A9P7AYG1_9HELO|nr:hypothetical protein D0Z07_3312 [Hyphodiscus hymeniophilus]